ncbi:MAG: thiamine biosynthesis protein ThiS [Leptospiraceae bacterium]|nr:MAG: thiamine biosynthesis protein ThiS [Leptospiraceae bacterium]
MIVNGKEVSIKELELPTIEELLKKYNVKTKMVAIEINGKVVPKSEWQNVQLKENDKIEVIRFVGGG